MIPRSTRILVLAFLMLSSLASSQTLPYQGYTEYDDRPAILTLIFSGSSVTGKLHVNPVCESYVHLTGVDINLAGTATGPWESKSTSIKGTWNGGDLDPCSGGTIKNDISYPNAGDFKISIVPRNGKDAIRLVRMPTGYGYVFETKGYETEGSINAGSSNSGGVDLKIEDLSVPKGIGPGMKAEISVTFENNGAAAAGPFKLYGYAFPNQNNLIYSSDPVPIQDLKPGETKSATIGISIPSNAPKVPYDVKVAIDNSNYAGSGDVIETNENNNELWKRKISGPEGGSSTDSKADLVVSEVRVDPNQAAASSDPDRLTFQMELKNLGKTQAKGFYTGFYLSADRSITADDIYIGYGIVDLKAGESRSGPIPCKIPADITPGLYYIGVIADPQEKVDESDETNNALATDEPIPIPMSLIKISGEVQAFNQPGSQTETVYLQIGQIHTFQMPDAGFASGIRFDEAGITSLTHSEHDNFVKLGPAGVLSGDGEEILGSGTSISLTAMKEGTASVRMTAFWQAMKSNGEMSSGYQDYTWTVIVGSSKGEQDKYEPPSSNIPEKSGEITSGKIRGKVIYRPTGEPVAGATIHSLDFEDEARGAYPVNKLNSDGSVKELLKTGSDGTFEIDIATWVSSGIDPGRFWIRIIKPYEGPKVQETWSTVCLDLWVIQSPLKTFSLTKENAEAGPIDVGMIMMDRSSNIFSDDCPIDPNTGRAIDDPNWP